MKLFLFEFATCGGEVDDSIAVEGLAMFKSLYSGFSKRLDVISFVREDFSFLGLPVGDLEDLETKAEESDLFLIVAPEDDWLLYELTRVCEKYSYNLGSSSRAIRITSDKWEMYKKLKRRVTVPRTSKRELDGRFLIKPRVSCGGSGIRFSDSVPEGYIAQEYIEGKPLSVSLIVDEDILPVSVNEQILKGFEYLGGVVPAKIDEGVRREAEDEAIEAVACIRGLHGYVGVDVVYADRPYVIEVNARLTTPSVAFEFSFGKNVADFIWEGLFEELEVPDKSVRHKISKSCDGKVYAKVGSYCISIEEY